MEPAPDTQSAWRPPETYRPLESAVPGIQVYAPKEALEAPEQARTYTCPNCGATTRYDVRKGGVACEYCGYSLPAPAEQIGRGAQQFEFTLETWQQAEKGWGVERQDLHCENCGASLSLPAGALTVTCPFCGSNRVSVRPAPADNLRPLFLVPFRVLPDDLRKRAQEWLGRGWFHPAELRSSMGPQRFTGIYLPFWTFDARLNAHWDAEVGYERQESYYDAGSKTWQTRTVIDWRREQGDVALDVDDLLLSGSQRLSRRILERLYPFDLNALVAYNPDYLAGWQAQAYEVTLTNAWEQAKERMRLSAKDACYADIPTSHVRNFSMRLDFANEAWRYLLLPVYLAAYPFEGKVYQVMVNGQTGAIAGQKPVEWWKVWLAIALLLAPGITLGLIGLPALALGGLGVIFLLAAAVLLVIGAGLSVAVYRQAVESEAA